MDDARKLLDSLMGPSRDKAKKEQQKADGWKERNVCKRFLVGFCPNDAQDNWFKNTRRDVGTCNKIHSEHLRELFRNHPERRKFEPEYEKDFLHFLEGLVSEADAWISREKRNCRPAGKEGKLPQHVRDSVATMQEQSDRLLKQAEDLAEAGNLTASKEAVAASTKMKEEIADLRDKYANATKTDEVCEVCGVRCEPDEPGKETPGAEHNGHYMAHLGGKLHLSYVQIRDTVKELREKVRNAPQVREQREDSAATAGDNRRRRRHSDLSRSRSGRRRSRSRGRRRR